MAAFGTTVRL
jgi:hypothetical protein